MIAEKTIKELASGNEIYFKLLNDENRQLTIVCLQWFDEFDYDNSKFFKIDGEDLVFSTEELAVEYLNSNFNKEDIDPEYYRVRRKLKRNI